MSKPHSCLSSNYEFVEIAAKNQMKAEAYSTAAPLNDIYHQVLGDYPDEIGSGIGYLRVLSSLKDARSKRYQRANCTVAELVAHVDSPDCLEEIKQWCQGTVKYTDNAGTRHYAIILGSDKVLEHVDERNHYLLCDATFRTAPRPFSQLFNVMVSYEGVAIPVLHACMSSKHSGLYEGVLMKIRELYPQLEPKIVKSDFEMGLMKAVRAAFPNVTISGCYFHYAQAVFRAIMRVGNQIHIFCNKYCRSNFVIMHSSHKLK